MKIMIKLNRYNKFFLFGLFLGITHCNEHKTETAISAGKTPDSPIVVENKPVDNKSTACDPNLWKYVYDPERLQVLDTCKIVTGTIEETNADEDGDQHMLLRLDKGQENLLTKKNMKKKSGDLVIEAVCINNITRKKALGACTGYVNHVTLPRVGDHVKVTGSYVIDSNNGWSEIHPITKIEMQ